MSAAPRLSILVPSFNYGHFLDEALESLTASAAELEPGEVEIVVVDDGSTDSTPEVLAGWDGRRGVRCHRQENLGVAGARNTAMGLARGQYLMFFDADDVLLPGCVTRTVAFLDTHPDVGLFFTNYDIFDETGVVTASGVDLWKVFRELPHEELEDDAWLFTEPLSAAILEYGSFMHTSGLTIRASLARRVGGFRKGYTYGEDDDYWARCAHRTTAAYLDAVLSRKRNHEQSIIHDRSRVLANAATMLALTELQREEYEEPAILRILERKARRCSVDFIWEALQAGRPREATPVLGRYLRRYPWSPTYLRLALKWLSCRLRPRATRPD